MTAQAERNVNPGDKDDIEPAGAGVDRADSGGVLLKVGELVARTDALRGGRADLGMKFDCEGVGDSNVGANLGGDAGGDEGQDGTRNDDDGEDDRPREVSVHGEASLGVIGLEALGGDGLELRGERGQREEQARRHFLGPVSEGNSPGMEDGRASRGVDVGADFGGVFE